MAISLIGIKPIHTRVLVAIYDDGDTSIMLGGKKFYLLDDSSADRDRDIHRKHQGVRARWAMVLAISDTVQEWGYVNVGDKVLLDELKWSRGMKANLNKTTEGKVWSIPSEDILGVLSTDFTEPEKLQITKMYPDWETWTARDV